MKGVIKFTILVIKMISICQLGKFLKIIFRNIDFQQTYISLWEQIKMFNQMNFHMFSHVQHQQTN